MSTKIHATCDALGNPTGFYLTAGQAHDLQGADVLIVDIDAEALLGDKAYDADERVRQVLKAQGIEPVIPGKSNRQVAIDYDKELYKARHLIENFFAKLKRYDKRAVNFLGAVYLAASVVWLN